MDLLLRLCPTVFRFHAMHPNGLAGSNFLRRYRCHRRAGLLLGGQLQLKLLDALHGGAQIGMGA